MAAQKLPSAFGDDFGQKIDLTARIREILVNYPPGSTIIKEFLQNADDAGASVIKFCVDERSFGTATLAHEKLGQFQVRSWRRTALPTCPLLLYDVRVCVRVCLNVCACACALICGVGVCLRRCVCVYATLAHMRCRRVQIQVFGGQSSKMNRTLCRHFASCKRHPQYVHQHTFTNATGACAAGVQQRRVFRRGL